MSFGLRKSFSSGPFRFTLSRRGLNTSFGIRGARISAGPRGTFVNLSSHGIYYRQRIGASTHKQNQPSAATYATQPIMDSVFQVPITELSASDQSTFVNTLNEDMKAFNPAPIVGLLSCFAFVLMLISSVLGFFIVLTGFVAALWLQKRFKENHTQSIHYDLDAQAGEKFSALQRSLESLMSCSKLWTLHGRAATYDFKRNAGASTLVTRRQCTIGRIPTRGFNASIGFTSIAADGIVMHFLPDQILLFSANRYASVKYDEINVSAIATRFIEEGVKPQDSVQLDWTWRFVNKDGGPDRRFSNNRKLPILQYGEVAFKSATGLHIVVQSSNYAKAETFATGFCQFPNRGP